MSKLVAGRNYDVLDNHSKAFTQPNQEFAPRINRRKAESHLIKNGFYNPIKPPIKSASKSVKKNDDNQEFEENYEPMVSARTTARTNTALSDRSNTANDHNTSQLNQSIQSTNKNQSIHEESFKKKETNLKKMTEK